VELPGADGFSVKVDVWQEGKKLINNGRIYRVYKNREGAHVIAIYPWDASKNITYEATYYKDPGSSLNHTDNSSHLPKIKLHDLAWFSSLLEEAGMKSLHKAVEDHLQEAVEGAREVDFKDFVRLVRENTKYSYVLGGELPPLGRNPVTAWRMNINEKGDVCFQCDGSNDLTEKGAKIIWENEWGVSTESRNVLKRRPGVLEIRESNGHKRLYTRGVGDSVYIDDATPIKMDERNPQAQASEKGAMEMVIRQLAKVIQVAKTKKTPSGFHSLDPGFAEVMIALLGQDYYHRHRSKGNIVLVEAKEQILSPPEEEKAETKKAETKKAETKKAETKKVETKKAEPIHRTPVLTEHQMEQMAKERILKMVQKRLEKLAELRLRELVERRIEQLAEEELKRRSKEEQKKRKERNKVRQEQLADLWDASKALGELAEKEVLKNGRGTEGYPHRIAKVLAGAIQNYVNNRLTLEGLSRFLKNELDASVRYNNLDQIHRAIRVLMDKSLRNFESAKKAQLAKFGPDVASPHAPYFEETIVASAQALRQLILATPWTQKESEALEIILEQLRRSLGEKVAQEIRKAQGGQILRELRIRRYNEIFQQMSQAYHGKFLEEYTRSDFERVLEEIRASNDGGCLGTFSKF